MKAEDVFFTTLSSEELWKRYCGFLDLSVSEFLRIQRSLFAEQISLVSDSALGRVILGTRPPRTIEEFRGSVPLTTYEDYEPYLPQRREDALAATPAVWCHSSGRGGDFKWVPHSEALMEKTDRNLVGVFNLATASRRGEITIGPGMRLLTVLPLAPYMSGTFFAHLRKRFTFQPIPIPESVADLPFQAQIARAFEIALRQGFDVAGAIASVMVRMGQQMAGEAARSSRFSASVMHPRVLLRLLRAFLKSRAERRSVYPRDLWSPKAIMAGGVDMSIYREEIEKYWGVSPFDVYGSTETMILAMQSWTRSSMTFLPDSVFLEFLPHEESREAGAKPVPTVLLDQLEIGRLYEVIITQLHGMPLLRYRLGDVIEVVGLGDEKAGIMLPQIEVRRKVGETINLGGLCNLDERTLWKGIVDTGLPYTDWTACKEYDRKETCLRLIIELKEPSSAAEVSRLVDARLKTVDTDYMDVERYLGVNPVRTTVVAKGTFARYAEAMAREGAALSHFKPKHINPSDSVVRRLLAVGAVEDRE